MTIKEYVDTVLCVPLTRVGNKFIVEAIELVVDTREPKFYEALSEITHKRQSYLETSIRSAKVLGLYAMNPQVRTEIFGNLIAKGTPKNMEYILKAAEYYRRTYEDKKG